MKLLDRYRKRVRYIQMSQAAFLVIGLQGSGKTAVARKIAEKFSAVLLRSDVLRRELFPVRTYSREESIRVYEEMLFRGKDTLQKGKSVVWDAKFGKESERRPFLELVESVGAEYRIIMVICDEKILEKRINARTGDESEAAFEIYLRSKSSFEPPRERNIVFDNSGPVENIDRFVETLK